MLTDLQVIAASVTISGPVQYPLFAMASQLHAEQRDAATPGSPRALECAPPSMPITTAVPHLEGRSDLLPQEKHKIWKVRLIVCDLADHSHKSTDTPPVPELLHFDSIDPAADRSPRVSHPPPIEKLIIESGTPRGDAVDAASMLLDSHLDVQVLAQ